MLFMFVSFIFASLIGTLIALRLMAIEAQEKRSPLTTRGKIVVALLIGIGIGLFVIFINGFWWNCDNVVCQYTWGY